jgi:hypothetical protein
MGSKKLTTAQQAALDYVAECDERYRQVKATARTRAMRQIEQEIETFKAARDRAVYDAVQAGVPKRQVGIHGLHTSSPNTIQDAYDAIAKGIVNLNVELAKKHVERFTALRRGRTHYGPNILVGDSEAFVNPQWEGIEQVPAGEGYLFVWLVHEWKQWPTQAETDPAPEGMLEWVKENGDSA